MTTMQCNEARELLPAHGELDVPHALALDAHLAACPACRDALTAEREFGALLRSKASYQRMPEALRSQLRNSLPRPAMAAAPAATAAAAASPSRHRRPRGLIRWGQWALPTAAALVLAVGANSLLAGQRADSRLVDDVVAGHVRSLLVRSSR